VTVVTGRAGIKLRRLRIVQSFFEGCFINVCIIAENLRMLLGMTLVGCAATIFLDVPLIILLLMTDNYEV
jgi:hypothetical protein